MIEHNNIRSLFIYRTNMLPVIYEAQSVSADNTPKFKIYKQKSNHFLISNLYIDRLPQIAKKLEKEKKIQLPKALLEYRRKRQNGFEDFSDVPQLPTVQSILDKLEEKRKTIETSPARTAGNNIFHLNSEPSYNSKTPDRKSRKCASFEEAYDRIVSFTSILSQQRDSSPLSEFYKSKSTSLHKPIGRLVRITK
jgi:hypothetical protein